MRRVAPLEWLKRRLLGTPEKIPRRVFTLLILVCVAIALYGAFLATRTGLQEAGASSLPYLRPILQITTSTWAYVAVLALVIRRILLKRSDLYASQAAETTGYSTESVRRLSLESQSTDGSTRVIATTDDETGHIEDRILSALETGEDDTMSINPAAVSLEDDSDHDLDLDESESDWNWSDVSESDSESEGALVAADASEEHVDEEPAEGVSDSWRENYKVWRLDLASTLDFERILWSVVAPAGITIVAILIAVRLWVQPWLYPPILAAGLLVGLLNYLRVSWSRSRSLESLREDSDVVNWSDVSILVKEVEVPETTMYYGWLAGRRYADEDRERYAEHVATRAYERVNHVDVSPSILEKQAEQLEDMYPDLHGFRDTERERIMTWLLDRVDAADMGLIPKAKLIEEAIEHDISQSRFALGDDGKGYDPDLVAECYRDLVPAALVEQEIPIGDDESVTAVRHRKDPLPPEYGEIRAQFASQFSNYAKWSPLWEVPDVSDKLEEEPRFSNSLGAKA